MMNNKMKFMHAGRLALASLLTVAAGVAQAQAVSTLLSINPPIPTLGQAVTLTATLNGGANPTGSVTFSDGTSPLGTVNVSSGGDPYFSNVSLLLHADGANGSTSLVDSTHISTLTANGIAAVETSAVKFGTGALQLSNGSSAGWVTAPGSSALDLSVGDFTIEFWVYPNASGPQILINKANNTSYYPWQILINGSGALEARGFNSGNGLVYDMNGPTVTTGVWHHVALVNAGSALTLYLDGTSVGTASLSTPLYSAVSDPLSIGAYSGGLYPLNGYMDEIRITKGLARYVANFTPASAAFPDTPNSAALALGPLAVGQHSLIATYSGDANNAASTSSPQTVVIQKATTTTAMTTSTNSSGLGQPVAMNVSVQGYAPTGSVTFYDGSTAIGSSSVNATGAASLSTTSLGVGTHFLSATYIGDGNNGSSNSSVAAVTVGSGSSGAMTWVYGYDAGGNRWMDIDPNGNSTTRQFDSLDRSVQVSRPAGAGASQPTVVSMAYDGADRVSQVTDPRGLNTNYSLDGLGNSKGLTSPDTGAAQYAVDAAGNVTSVTDARGSTTTFTYDALNRLTKASYASGTPIQFQYDGGTNPAPNSIGRLTQISDESGTTAYTYDAQGRVLTKTQVVAGQSMVVGYAWGSSGINTGLPTSITYPSGAQVNFSYDAAGRPIAVTVNPMNANGVGTATATTINVLSGISYNADKRPLGWTWADGGAYQRSYDSFGRLSTYPLGNPTGTGVAAGLTRTLSYDSAGRITGYTHANASGAQSGYDQSFGYDNLDRLTSAQISGTSYGYAYDPSGNRTTRVVGASSYASAIDPASNRLTQVQSPGPVTTNYSYDAAGHLTGDNVATYTYSSRGRLSGATTSNGTLSYLYNGLQQRVNKSGAPVSSGAAYYVYDEAGHLLGEYDANLNVISETVYLGDTPIAVLKTSGSAAAATLQLSVANVYADHLNTPRVITRSSDEAILWRWDGAEAFGVTPATESPSGLAAFKFNQRFPGQVYDAETGNFQNVNRDYQPGNGRYVQSDPIGLNGGINTYAYVGGNPLNHVDPSGLVACPGGTWDEEAGDFSISVSFGIVYIGGNLNYTCRSNPRIKVKAVQNCIGGGAMAGIGVGWSFAGTTYGADDSSDLGGWQTNQLFSNFNLGPVGLGGQAPVDGNPGGSGSVGGGLGFGVAYGSCHVKIHKVKTCGD